MKRPIPIQIFIPEPCTQPWDQMQPTGSGWHCAHCQQTVVDFTRMTDAALLEYVQRNGLGCGQFRNEQLDRIILPLPETKGRNWALRLVAGFLLIAGWSKEVVAQKKSKAHISQNPSGKNHGEADTRDENRSLIAPNESVQRAPCSIDGVAMDQYGSPLINAVISVSDTTGALLGNVLTDFDGVFTIPLANRNYVGEIGNISITYLDVKQLKSVKLVAGQNVIRMTIARPPITSLVQTTRGGIRPLVDFPKAHHKETLPAETNRTGMVEIADMASLASGNYLGTTRKDSIVSSGGGRAINTPFVAEGVLLYQPKKTFWQRLRFWRK